MKNTAADRALSLTAAQLLAMAPAGVTHVVIAESREDRSEIQSDYFNAVTTRTVVLGFRTASRDNFKTFRKLAATFPETAHLGPGKGRFTVTVVHASDVRDGGRCYWEGDISPWHSEISGQTFDTRAAAEAFAATAAPSSLWFGDVEATFRVRVHEDSIEHRENWSMGRGNYLGIDKYSGWIVSTDGLGHRNADTLYEIAPAFARALGFPVAVAA